jgi:hypothetical protein
MLAECNCRYDNYDCNYHAKEGSMWFLDSKKIVLMQSSKDAMNPVWIKIIDYKEKYV